MIFDDHLEYIKSYQFLVFPFINNKETKPLPKQ